MSLTDQQKNELVVEAKERLRITHSTEDDKLTRLIVQSHAAITSICGLYDVDSNHMARELILERVRYAFNDSVEFFAENFAYNINTLAFELALNELREGDAQ